MSKLIWQVDQIWSGHGLPLHPGPFHWKRKVSAQSVNRHRVKSYSRGINIWRKIQNSLWQQSEVHYNSGGQVHRTFVSKLWESPGNCSTKLDYMITQWVGLPITILENMQDFANWSFSSNAKPTSPTRRWTNWCKSAWKKSMVSGNIEIFPVLGILPCQPRCGNKICSEEVASILLLWTEPHQQTHLPLLLTKPSPRGRAVGETRAQQGCDQRGCFQRLPIRASFEGGHTPYKVWEHPHRHMLTTHLCWPLT